MISFWFALQREVEILMFLSAIVMMKNRRACKITPTPNTTQHYSLCKPTDVPSRQVVVYTVNNHVILSGRHVVENRADQADSGNTSWARQFSLFSETAYQMRKCLKTLFITCVTVVQFYKQMPVC